MAGRKPKLTAALIDLAGSLSTEGKLDVTIYKAMNVASVTFYRWQSEGEKAKAGLKAQFTDALRDGRELYQQSLLEGIEKQGHAKDWKALAWILERRWPHRYGQRSVVGVKDTGRGKLEDPEDARKRLAAEAGIELAAFWPAA